MLLHVNRGDYPSDSPKRIRIQLPVAGLGVLMLGPGTSISANRRQRRVAPGPARQFCIVVAVGFQLIAWRRRSRRRPGGRSPKARLVANEGSPAEGRRHSLSETVGH